MVSYLDEKVNDLPIAGAFARKAKLCYNLSLSYRDALPGIVLYGVFPVWFIHLFEDAQRD
jgi:hypothetical protein